MEPERRGERVCSSKQGGHGKSCLERAFEQRSKEGREGAPWISGERCPEPREQLVQRPGHREALRAGVAGQHLGKASGEELRDDGIGQGPWEAFSL